MTFPWETPLPAVTEPVQTPQPADVVTLLQRDVAFLVRCTAIKVHSSRPEFEMLVNTARGQLVPRGECRFTDGTTFELQDIGMPQPGAPLMTVQELMAHMWDIAQQLGLKI